MGFFFQNYSIATVGTLILLIAALVALNELTRRNKIAAAIFYGVIPALLVIGIALNLVDSPSSRTWFGVVKTFSALAGVWGFLAIRYTKVGKTKFTYYFPFAILAINILEAMVKEVEVYKTYEYLVVDQAGITMLGGIWNIFNSFAGFFLLITLTGWMGIKVAKTKSLDMVWADQLWFWILAYDLWNVAYCYNCISTRSMYSGVALIASCTIAEVCFKHGAWLQHRAQTLALFGMFSLFFDYQASDYFKITATYNPTAWTVLSFAALVVNVLVFVYEVYVIVKYKRNPLKQEMFTHLKSYRRNLEVNSLK